MPIHIAMALGVIVERCPAVAAPSAGSPEPAARFVYPATATSPWAWGRPLRPEPSRPPAGSVALASCPPPAPDIDLRGSPAPQSDPGAKAKGTWELVAKAAKRTAPAVALAAALAGVAALTYSPPRAASPQQAWAAKVTPHLDAIAIDVERLAVPVGTAAPTHSASADLRSQLKAARAVGQSPVLAWGKLWTSALDEAQAALGLPVSADSAKLADLTFAADDLVALGQEITAGS